MPVYEYSALDRAGRKKNGIIDADSPVTARQKLRLSGIFPIEMKESLSASKEQVSSSFSSSFLFRKVKPSELSAATRQISILIGAGVTLVESLDALIRQAANPAFKKILVQVKESVNQGNSLASSLSQHPKVFSQIYINMVRAGEASGSLDLVLDRLAEFSEHQVALKGRLKAALAYPILMSIIGFLVLFFLIAFIVPNITKIFSEMHQVLPLPTLLLISASNLLKSFWWVLLLFLACGVFFLKKAVRKPKGRVLWDRIKLRSPIMGTLTTKVAVARFSRTLGTLLQNGVPLLSALQIVRNIVNNILIGQVIDDAIEEIRTGKTLAASLGRSRWFPPVAVQMISVGERSGELENMLHRLADIYEKEVESQTLAMTSMLEPVMILVMGLVVGFVVISILLPIFEMNQMIR